MSATPSKINRLKESLLSSAAKMAVVAARLTPSYNSLPARQVRRYLQARLYLPGPAVSGVSRMNSELKQAFQEISRRIVHLRDSL
jgi:hypothetical protein